MRNIHASHLPLASPKHGLPWMLLEELQESARWALEHAERFQPVRSGVVLRRWHYPTFDVWRSWTVFSGEAGSFLVRELLWDRPRQCRRLFDPLHGLRELGKPLPMFRVREAIVPSGQLAPLITRAPELFPPPPAPAPLGLDGEGNGAAVIVEGEEQRTEWWCDGPKEWRPLVEWAEELRDLLNREA